jgi:hypothetical protein
MTTMANQVTPAQKAAASDAKFSTTFKAFAAGQAGVLDLLHALGNAHGMTHFNTALVLGKNPIPALKADLQKLGNSKAAVASKDYFRAWVIATHAGNIKGHNLPTPPTVTAALSNTKVSGEAMPPFTFFGALFATLPPATLAFKNLYEQNYAIRPDWATWSVSPAGQTAIRAYQQGHGGLYVSGRYDTDTAAALKADGVLQIPPNPVQPLKHLDFHLAPHPTQVAAAAAPVPLTQPIPVPVDQTEIVAATGAPVVAPVPAPGSSFVAAATPNPQWKIGGAAALAVPGMLVAGPPGAVGGAVAGLLGGKVLDDRIKQGLMQPIFARDANGKINLPLSFKKWTGKLPQTPPAPHGGAGD